MSEWIDCKDRLPDSDSHVLAILKYIFSTDLLLNCEGYSILTLMYFDNENGKCWFDDRTGYQKEYEDITHWMPLPELPVMENLYR